MFSLPAYNSNIITLTAAIRPDALLILNARQDDGGGRVAVRAQTLPKVTNDRAKTVRLCQRAKEHRVKGRAMDLQTWT